MHVYIIYIFYSGNYKFLLILLQEGVHHDTFFSNYHTHTVYVNTLLHLRSNYKKILGLGTHIKWFNPHHIFVPFPTQDLDFLWHVSWSIFLFNWWNYWPTLFKFSFHTRVIFLWVFWYDFGYSAVLNYQNLKLWKNKIIKTEDLFILQFWDLWSLVILCHFWKHEGPPW